MSVLFRSNAEGEDLQKLIHAAGFKNIGLNEFLDADGNHCYGDRESGAYEICSLWQHANDDMDPE